MIEPEPVMQEKSPLHQGAGHPLGPWLYRIANEGSRRVRTRAAAVLAGCMLLLGLGLALDPDPSGMGTHRQLGLTSCGLVATTGIPCPTCGMTTAFAYAVRARFVASARAQPFGALVALATFVAAGLSMTALITGRGWRVNWYRVPPGWVAAGAVLLFLTAWAYKIAAVRF